jgi:hypothetical protein
MTTSPNLTVAVPRRKHVNVHLYDKDNVARQTKRRALPSPVGVMQRGQTTVSTAKLVGLSNYTFQLLLAYQNVNSRRFVPLRLFSAWFFKDNINLITEITSCCSFPSEIDIQLP